MELYWLIIGPLALMAIAMLGGVWYVVGTAPRLAADDRGVGRDGGDLGDR